MGKQMTEMLKGTLEGIVLAILSGRPAYGYEITAWLREQGFSDIAEGTVYALLDQDRAARPRRRGEGPVREGAAAQGVLPQRSGTGIPRRVLEDLELPHRTARTAPRRRQMTWPRSGSSWSPDRSSRRSSTGSTRPASSALPEPYGTAVEGAGAVPHVLRGRHGRRDRRHDVRATSPTSGSAPRPTARPCARSSATTRSSSPRRSPQAYTGERWIDKERDRLTKRDRARRGRGRKRGDRP